MGHLHTGTVADVAAGGTGLRIGLVKSGGGDGEAGIIRVGNLVAAGGLHGGGIGMHTCVGDERHIALHHLQQVGEIHRTEFAEQTQPLPAEASAPETTLPPKPPAYAPPVTWSRLTTATGLAWTRDCTSASVGSFSRSFLSN